MYMRTLLMHPRWKYRCKIVDQAIEIAEKREMDTRLKNLMQRLHDAVEEFEKAGGEAEQARMEGAPDNGTRLLPPHVGPLLNLEAELVELHEGYRRKYGNGEEFHRKYGDGEFTFRRFV